MAGIEVNCPNCGSTEHTRVEEQGRLCTYCRTTYYPPRHLREQSKVVIRETIVKKQYIGVYAPEPYDRLQDAPAYEPDEGSNDITLYVVLGIAGCVAVGVVLLIYASL